MPAADTQLKATGCVAYWGVKSMAGAVTELEARGHTLFDPVTDVGGGIRVATLLDADKNLVGLIENPHFPNTQAS